SNKGRPPWRERVCRAGAPTGRFTASLYPPFFVRALTEILFKAQDALNDFLLQQSRAVELRAGRNCPARAASG
ncbi:hypothetical protein, partial [uncultured Rikenella sp.]|uniref:hypothetical protein n=1 Tax=uncultured Rikenella sp. TaxID=368003 RepID=UPI0025FC7E16